MQDYQHVIAGYKATISSPRTSEEAKGSARLMIAALEEAEQKSVGAAVEVDKDQDTIHHHRVIGGMKAALKVSHTIRVCARQEGR